MALGQVVVGHRAAVGLLQHLDRPIISPEKIQADAQPHPAGRAYGSSRPCNSATASRSDGVLREVAGDRLLHLPDIARAKGIVCQDGLFQIEFDGLRHPLGSPTLWKISIRSS